MTKPDVLDGFEEMMICVGYRYKQDLLRHFPTESWILNKVVPEYRKVKGWKRSIREARLFSDFPEELKDYIKTIEDLIEARVVLVSTGMERKDTVFRSEDLRPWLDLETIEAEL